MKYASKNSYYFQNVNMNQTKNSAKNALNQRINLLNTHQPSALMKSNVHITKFTVGAHGRDETRHQPPGRRGIRDGIERQQQLDVDVTVAVVQQRVFDGTCLGNVLKVARQPRQHLVAQRQIDTQGPLDVFLDVDVHHDVGDADMFAHEAGTCGFADLVALGHAQAVIDNDVHVYQRLTANAARAQQMQRLNTVNRENRSANRPEFIRRQPGVNQFAQRLPGEIDTDLDDHKRHDDRRRRIQITESQQAAADPRRHDQR